MELDVLERLLPSKTASVELVLRGVLKLLVSVFCRSKYPTSTKPLRSTTDIRRTRSTPAVGGHRMMERPWKRRAISLLRR